MYGVFLVCSLVEKDGAIGITGLMDDTAGGILNSKIRSLTDRLRIPLITAVWKPTVERHRMDSWAVDVFPNPQSQLGQWLIHNEWTEFIFLHTDERGL